MADRYENKLASVWSCSLCGREFEPLARYVSALFEEGEEFRRRDYCSDCWQGPPEGSFSYWQGRIPPKEAPPKRFVDDAELLELFASLASVSEPRQMAFRYLLGLLLVRKRLLKLTRAARRTAEGEERTMVIEEAGGGGTYEVAVPLLSQEELDRVSAQMGAVLRMAPTSATESEKEERQDV